MVVSDVCDGSSMWRDVCPSRQLSRQAKPGSYRRLRRGGEVWWGEEEIAAMGRQRGAGGVLTFSNFSMVRLSIPPHL
jgi:hypothetical protein